MKDVTYNIATTEGMTLAKLNRRECITLRTDLESMRKTIKAPALEKCKLIDTEAKRIESEIRLLEGPIDKQIKDQEKIKEDARLAREEEKRKKSMAIMEQIEKIKAIPEKVAHKPALDQTAAITWLSDLEFDEEAFDTFYGSAVEARDAALESMIATRDEKVISEAEEAMNESHRLALIDNAQIDHEKEEKRLEGIREEQRIEGLRLKKIEDGRVAEANRVKIIADKIEEIRNFWMTPSSTVEHIQTMIDQAKDIPVTVELFMEFFAEAVEQKNKTIEALESGLATKKENDALKQQQKKDADEKEAARLLKYADDQKEKLRLEKLARKNAREKKVLDAKAENSKHAFQSILGILASPNTDAEKLEEISIIAEANS